MQQKILLQMEYAAEKEAFRKLTETIGMQRRLKRGDAWWPVKTGKSYYNSLNQLSIEIHRTQDQDIEHNFEFGRPVAFFRGISGVSGISGISSNSGNSINSGSTLHYFPFTGTVSYVDGDRMVIVVPDNTPVIDLQNAEGLGVQLSFDETSYKMMFDALDRVMKANDNRLAYLRDLFYNTQIKPQTFSFQSITFPYLNKTQEEAVNCVLRSKDVMRNSLTVAFLSCALAIPPVSTTRCSLSLLNGGLKHIQIIHNCGPSARLFGNYGPKGSVVMTNTTRKWNG